MDGFRLKTIDEFDEEFVASLNSEINDMISSAKSSLIPEMSNTTGQADNIMPPSLSENTLYASERMSETEFVPPSGSAAKEKVKSSKGALAGKIISIILLVATIVIFLSGCFVSIFLDNKGQTIGGYTLNNLSADIEKISVKKGDMIIAKKLKASDYKPGDLIAVPASNESGCLIVSVASSAVTEESSVITVNDLMGTSGSPISFNADDVLGQIQSYIPHLGGLISFAMDNAVIVCVVFVLLAVLWCLILVLIEISESKKARKQLEAESDEPKEFVLNIEDDYNY